MKRIICEIYYLRQLRFEFNILTDALHTGTEFAAILTGLTTPHLEYNSITREGQRALAQALAQTTKLQRLAICRNELQLLVQELPKAVGNNKVLG